MLRTAPVPPRPLVSRRYPHLRHGERSPTLSANGTSARWGLTERAFGRPGRTTALPAGVPAFSSRKSNRDSLMMTFRLFRLRAIAAVAMGTLCACTNLATGTHQGSVAQPPRLDISATVHANPVSSEESNAQAEEVAPSGGADEAITPDLVGARSESSCGGAATRRAIAYLVWANPAFSEGLCGDAPCTESELSSRLVYYDDVLRDAPRVEACQVYDQTALHIVSALFAIDGTHAKALMVYRGYSLDCDPDHRSHGYKDLIGLQNEGFMHWVEERFVWDGRSYNLKHSRRLRDGALK